MVEFKRNNRSGETMAWGESPYKSYDDCIEEKGCASKRNAMLRADCYRYCRNRDYSSDA